MIIKDILLKYNRKIDYLDLELIISHVLKKSREAVLAHPEHEITKRQAAKIIKFIKRRQKHEPLAYILEHKEFYGLDFKVNQNTLVPRPETEMLVDETLSLLRSMLRNKTAVIDIGSGSGNIIISIAKELEKNYKFFGIDISPKALTVAKNNAKKHKVDKKIKFLKSDLLDCFLKNNPEIKKFDNLIITANLPYLDIGWKNLLNSTETKGLQYEPSIALYSGQDGLDAYRKLAGQTEKIKAFLKNKNIYLFCEIGHLQKPKMEKIFSFAKKTSFKKDLAKKWRMAIVEI